jgi:hypothetical protein
MVKRILDSQITELLPILRVFRIEWVGEGLYQGTTLKQAQRRLLVVPKSG